jgi:hypothetical protein
MEGFSRGKMALEKRETSQNGIYLDRKLVRYWVFRECCEEKEWKMTRREKKLEKS